VCVCVCVYQLLKSKRCPFIVALNKVDRCYGWKECPDSPILAALADQPEHTVRELKDRWRAIQGEIAAQGLAFSKVLYTPLKIQNEPFFKKIYSFESSSGWGGR
jgi:translation initiation factor IF-2